MTDAHGKICYVEIPAADIAASAAFYERVFGWNTRHRGDGRLAFDDGVEVSGSWVCDRAPMRDPGLLIYIMTPNLADTLALIAGNGGEVIAGPREGAREMIGIFRDPAGNVLGLYQH